MVPWTEGDAILIEMWNRPGGNVADIAYTLHRSPDNVKKRAAKLRKDGVVLRNRVGGTQAGWRKNFVMGAIDREIARLWNETDLSLGKIGDMFRMTDDNVARRVKRMRAVGVDLCQAKDRKGAKKTERACNLCRQSFQPDTPFVRFCGNCRHNRREGWPRDDGNWAMF